MSQSKPIFTVGVPEAYHGYTDEIAQSLKGKIDDYHVIVYPAYQPDTVFALFNSDNSTDADIEQLKEFILLKMKEKS